MAIRLTILLALCIITPMIVLCQEKQEIKFGKISPQDFTITSSVVDSNTNAVVLADVGSSKIEGNNKGSWSLIHNRIRRVRIINKNGYDAANVSVRLFYSGGDEEKLTDVKAVTYNLENGAVQQTKLDASGIFKEKLDKQHYIKKFTFPNIKEGSIIEYSYKIQSDFLFNLQPWEFQEKYPRLYMEYLTRIPEFFVYVFLSQGYFPLKHDKKDRFQTYSITESNGTQANRALQPEWL